MKNVSQPVLAEAADILSDQLRALLSRLGLVLRPESDRLEKRFTERLRRMGFDIRQRRALAALTAGAAAQFLGHRRPPSEFFEQVEYNGRRLAKLNLSPVAIVSALSEYDKLLEPVLKRRLPAEHGNFQWVREQLQFCVLLTLNNAYYHVRETETQAFYEMFWAELQSRNLDDLLGRFLAILARFSKADEARLYLVDDDGALVPKAAFGGEPGSGDRPGGKARTRKKPADALPPAVVKDTARLRRLLARPRQQRPQAAGWVLDPDWQRQGRAGFARCWSVPMISNGGVAGVMQFAFRREYEWLPREQDLLTAAAERCMMAAEKAKLLEDLAAQQQQIRRLAENLMHVEEAERRRISHELHDQTGQDLLWIRLQMEMIERDLPDGDATLRPRLAEVRDMTERTIVEIRRLIAALSPAVLEQLGLAPALRQMVNRFRLAHPAAVMLDAGTLAPLSKQLETIAYRLVQECLNNAAKHSSCENVNISVRTDDGVLRLIVEDDGIGFRVEDRLATPGSFGLAGIRERVALSGGTCRIESTPAANPRQRRIPKPGMQSQAKIADGMRAKALRSANFQDLDKVRPVGGPSGKRPGTRIVVELPISGNLEMRTAGRNSPEPRGLAAAGIRPGSFETGGALQAGAAARPGASREGS
ncbi:MAG: GAF domain-containing sensor histidine kinase [Bryobacteraceae bacterium]